MQPHGVLPRELLPHIMAHWEARALGLTCWDLYRRLNPSAYVAVETVTRESAVSGNLLGTRVITSSRLPNGVLHGANSVTEANWFKQVKRAELYDRGKCTSGLATTIDDDVIEHRILVNGWKCAWKPYTFGNDSVITMESWGQPIVKYDIGHADFVERMTLETSKLQHGGNVSLM